MASIFPAGLDTFANPVAGPPGVGSYLANANPALVHSAQHGDANDAIEAIQAKVGVDSSAVATSLDFRVGALEDGPAPMTIAALVALRDAAALHVGLTYVVTDWTLPNSLPGPNIVIARATDASTLSPEVLVQTPVAGGPDEGEFDWNAAVMTTLRDVFQNEISDPFNAAGLLDAWPWGATNWVDNKLDTVVFTGGYATTSAAATAGVLVAATQAESATVDFAGASGGYLLNCHIISSTINFGSLGVYLTNTYLEPGAIIDNSGSSLIQASKCHLAEGTITNAATAASGTISLVGCTLAGFGAVITNTGVRGLSLSDVDLRGSANLSPGSTITQAVTVTGGTEDEIISCRLDAGSSITITGATDPAATRQIAGVTLSGNSALTVTDATGAAGANPVTNCEIANHSTLHVQSGGAIADSRISCGAVLNTGAFAHTSVIVDGQFTVTLTAPNTNTLKNKGFSDVV